MANETSTRRDFLEFFGRATAALGASSLLPTGALGTTRDMDLNRQNLAANLAANSTTKTETKIGKAAHRKLPFQPLEPRSTDQVELAKGFRSKILISWQDKLNSKGEAFGFNNDYIAFIPLAGPQSLAAGSNQITAATTATPSGKTRSEAVTEGILWVNHESSNSLFVSGWTKGQPRTKEQVIEEQKSVGGSLLRVRQAANAEWTIVPNDPLNRRLDARTPIPIIAARDIQGTRTAIGTLANCAGGVTPWQTVLTCEENYDGFYGEAIYSDKATQRKLEPSYRQWEKFFPYPPEHYGWVVEVNPTTGAAKKLTSLGRFAHECATTRLAKDGRCVVYSGDDGDDRCLYKFISDKPGSLETGTLYVMSLKSRRWIPLVYDQHEVLKAKFADQTDVLIRCREAAELVGGSRMDRPEDIEIDPATGAVYVCLTNNLNRGNEFGSVFKLVEKNNDPLALEFEFSTFLMGGNTTGFACPDNMCFDPKGNLWITTDMSGYLMNKGSYKGYGNNALFYVPMSGPRAGQAFRVASAPHDAEFTGPCFSPDERTLFLSVQHPGEESPSLDQLTSKWPHTAPIPRSAVLTLSGPALDSLMES